MNYLKYLTYFTHIKQLITDIWLQISYAISSMFHEDQRLCTAQKNSNWQILLLLLFLRSKEAIVLIRQRVHKSWQKSSVNRNTMSRACMFKNWSAMELRFLWISHVSFNDLASKVSSCYRRQTPCLLSQHGLIEWANVHESHHSSSNTNSSNGLCQWASGLFEFLAVGLFKLPGD